MSDEHHADGYYIVRPLKNSRKRLGGCKNDEWSYAFLSFEELKVFKGFTTPLIPYEVITGPVDRHQIEHIPDMMDILRKLVYNPLSTTDEGAIWQLREQAKETLLTLEKPGEDDG